MDCAGNEPRCMFVGIDAISTHRAGRTGGARRRLIPPTTAFEEHITRFAGICGTAAGGGGNKVFQQAGWYPDLF